MSNGQQNGAARGKSRSLAIGGLVVAAVFFLSLNVFSSESFRNIQVDLTQKGLYTLSDGTRQVLGNLQEPVTLRLFVSPTLLNTNPGIASYAARVQELLDRYVVLSQGKLSLEVINPEPYSPAEDRAVGLGMQGVPLDETGEKVYFGLAGTNTTDESDVIPFLSPQREQFLEYDLTRLINNVANPKKKIVGLLTDTSMEADPRTQYKPWRVVELMRQFFEVKSLYEPKQIKPGELDVLMIVHPTAMNDEMAYAVDQYVLAGGKALVFVDPFSEEVTRSNMAQRMPPDPGSALPKLFDAWGIAYDKSKFVADRRNAQRVGAEGPDGNQVIIDYVAWQNLNADNINAGDVITDKLNVVSVGVPGAIAKAPDSQLSFEPLLVSSPDSALVDTAKVRVRPDPVGLMRDFKPDEETHVLAARLSGEIKTAFPDGPPKKPEEKVEGTKEGAAKPEAKDANDAEEPADAEPAPLKQSVKPANIIVVGDVDMLADRFWLQTQEFFGRQLEVPTANNADFVINALDNLAGAEALIGLRSRGFSARPFTVVQDIRKDAERRYLDKEQALRQQLEETEKKLRALQTTEQGQGSAILTDEQKQAIDDFRGQIVRTRAELRNVQHALRQDIEQLDSTLKVINIAAMPALVLVIAIIVALVRSSRRRRHVHGG